MIWCVLKFYLKWFSIFRDIRENFIRAKYELKAWIPRETHSLHEVLNKKLCQVVKTDNVMETLELIVHGANVRSSVCLSINVHYVFSNAQMYVHLSVCPSMFTVFCVLYQSTCF